MFRLNGQWGECPNNTGEEHYVGRDSYGSPYCYSCAADELATRELEAHETALRAKHGDNWHNVRGTELE